MSIYEEMIPYLLHWYKYNARVLPWREDPSAYHVWVSEIMLQQTRVEAVRSYYMRFLDALPTVKALAECPDDELMKLWEGLGYYSRVRNLKKAAQAVVKEYGGAMPHSAEQLKKFPGIGDYTAGAIASIAFGLAEPAVDGNVLRVLSRLTGSRENIAEPAVKKNMTAKLKKVMPGRDSGKLNQAIMDLGATVCIPNGVPHCELCPVAHLCTAYREQTTAEIPVKSAPKARRVEQKTVFLIETGKKRLLRKRPEKGLLAGLYEYPNVSGELSEEQARKWVKETLADCLGEMVECIRATDAVHIFSHVEWHMRAYRIRINAKRGGKLPEGYVSASAAERKRRYCLPSAFGKWDD